MRVGESWCGWVGRFTPLHPPSAGAIYPPFEGENSRSRPQRVALDVQPLVKSSFSEAKVSPNDVLILSPPTEYLRIAFFFFGGGQRRWPVRVLTPDRVRKLLGVWRGGGGSPGQSPGPRGRDPWAPHDALNILNIHNWGKNNFQKKIAHQLRPPISQGPTRRSGRGSKIFFVFFTHFLNSPHNSEYFEWVDPTFSI